MSQSELYVSLDIGSSTVKVLIGEMANQSLHVIGVGNIKSNGIRRGAIVDIDATVQSIRQAVEQAERMIGKSINEVVLGIPANQVKLQPVKGVVAVNSENREITDMDLERVHEAAQVVSIPTDREFVNVVPVQYIVDHVDDIEDPRGMMGIRLEMDGIMITTSKTILHNVLRCVERAGLTIRDIYVQPLVAGHIALTEDEKYQGAVCIDIGGGSTSMAVFQEGHLVASAVLPIGGDHVTKDLSIVLKTPTEQAEQIKLQHGHAFYDDASESEFFEVPAAGAASGERYSQKYISEIIGVRLEEMFDMILDELHDLGIRDLPGGVVLTGGMAKLEGIQDLAHHILQSRVRLFSPAFIGVREPQYTTAVGLIQYAYMDDMFYGRLGGGSALGNSVSKEDVQQPKKQKQPRVKEKSGEGVTARAKRFIDKFFE
ncbi:cell division protein FtsA [Planococcus lenghuensis]|uniref:Cell division protein FtsA n=1 Tax=Planococcus lenghuensis TaxID=2213202 RepID=A0A1Q2L409_9BACL|nr:cell division protein FtsA [Planococcus lenghuensis]AQQ55114.1 cell division protein FtsA [Planococcus lenghuensis]